MCWSGRSIGPDNEGHASIVQNCLENDSYGTIWIAAPNGKGLKFITVRVTDTDRNNDYPYPIYELWSDGNVHDQGLLS